MSCLNFLLFQDNNMEISRQGLFVKGKFIFFYVKAIWSIGYHCIVPPVLRQLMVAQWAYQHYLCSFFVADFHSISIVSFSCAFNVATCQGDDQKAKHNGQVGVKVYRLERAKKTKK